MGGFRDHTPRRSAPRRALPLEPTQKPSPRSITKFAALGSALAIILTIGGSTASASPLESMATAIAETADQLGIPTGISTTEPDLVGDVEPSFETGDLPPGTVPNPLTDTKPVITELPSDYTFFLDGLPTAKDAKVDAAKLPWFVRPVPFQVGGKFGLRFHPILHYWRMHNGVDMGGACRTPVVASAAGTVSFAGWNGGYGNLVVIDHGVVNGYHLQTKYAHLSVIGVRVGQKVTVGQGIALVGTTGLSTGCHLHFEVKLNGNYVNPEPFLNGKPSPTPTIPIEDLTPANPLATISPSASPSPSVSVSPSPSVSVSPTESLKPTGSPSAKPTTPSATSPNGSQTPSGSGTPTSPGQPSDSATPSESPEDESPSGSPSATGTQPETSAALSASASENP